jgi:hypothetical protein
VYFLPIPKVLRSSEQCFTLLFHDTPRLLIVGIQVIFNLVDIQPIAYIPIVWHCIEINHCTFICDHLSLWTLSNTFYKQLQVKLTLTTTYRSRFIPEGIAEASQIFLRDVLPKLFSYEYTADVTGGKPIAVWSQSISGVHPLVALYTSMQEKGAILLFCPGHHTRYK